MLQARRRLLAPAGLAAAALLSGCMTPQVKPATSQAVLDARAHRDAPPSEACPATPLSEVSPVTVGFPFDESGLSEPVANTLVGAARWLGCHPAVAVVIRPEADGHGAAAEQDALARARAATASNYLTTHGIAAARIRVLARGQADPTGSHFLVRAEGRRW